MDSVFTGTASAFITNIAALLNFPPLPPPAPTYVDDGKLDSNSQLHKTLACKWGGEGYKNQKQKWTFQREKADRLQSGDEPRMRGDREKHSISDLFSPRPSTAPSAGIFDRHDPRDKASGKEKAMIQYCGGMAVDAEELWFSHPAGRYKVNRKNAQAVESGKAPQQHLNITHHRTPYANQRDLADGPIVSIHKHSNAVAFSISRHYRLRPTMTPKTTTSSLRPPTTSRMPNTPTNVDANQKKSTSMILLGPRRVQEAYANTTTTRKLESHGLLDESRRTSPRDLERTKRERDREMKAKEKGEKKEMENAKNSRRSKSKSDTPKQEFSSESSVGSAARAISSGGSLALETTPSDRTVSHMRYRRHVGDDSEDDDDLLTSFKRRTHTPHQEAYKTTLDSSKPTPLQKNGFGTLFSWRKHRSTSSASRAAKPYKPPWAVASYRHNFEVRKDIVDDLKMSFQDVGLLPTLHEIEDLHHSSQKHKCKQQSSENSRRLTSDAAQADIFKDIPTDSLCMLLPLWPGETDAKSAQKYPYTMPVISTDSRQYLLIYYKVPFQMKNSKRSRNSRTSSHESVKNRNHVLLTTFHISARVVAYHDLQGSGFCIPDQGLAVQGALADAYGSMPTSIRDQGLVDGVIGMCHSREAGIEFLPDSLQKMDLCRSLPNSPAGDLRDEGDEEVESDLVLTPIGRAVIEMAWLGGMALTSFGPDI